MGFYDNTGIHQEATSEIQVLINEAISKYMHAILLPALSTYGINIDNISGNGITNLKMTLSSLKDASVINGCDIEMNENKIKVIRSILNNIIYNNDHIDIANSLDQEQINFLREYV